MILFAGVIILATMSPALVVPAKVAGFAALMFIFAHWLETYITRFFNNIGKPPHPMLLITATGLMMAGYGRNPESVGRHRRILCRTGLQQESPALSSARKTLK